MQAKSKVFKTALMGVALLTCLFASLFTQALAQNLAVPELTGRVVDQANMLSRPAEVSLTARLKAHEEKSGNQVVVLTIPSLKGENLEQFTLRAARTWALGQKDKNNGVLFLVSKNDRKMRIEVGYGLEGTLTDALASRVIRRDITPLFRQGKFETGIRSGVTGILQILEADAATLEAYKEQVKPTTYTTRKDNGEFLFTAAIFTIWFFLFFGTWIMGWLTKRYGREVKPGHWRWLWHNTGPNAPKPKRSSGSRRRSSSGFGGGFSSGSRGGGGFSGGGGSFGGGGSSGSW